MEHLFVLYAVESRQVPEFRKLRERLSGALQLT
jgi:hypothetical protein